MRLISLSPLPALIAAVLIGGMPTRAAATTYDALSFFETQVPDACTAASVSDIGSYVRQYKGPPGECSGLTTYHIVHGAGTHPWSTESLYTSGGYLWQMMEIFINDLNGSIQSYRAFRNQVNFWKGIPILPSSFSSPSFMWNYPDFIEEYWTDSSGTPACFNTQQTEFDGSVNWGYVYYAGTYSDWLQDKRAASLNQSTWHDVEVIVRLDQWASSNYEYYYYARWHNPATATWQGLGIIKWEQWIDSQLTNSFENHYLVDCNATIECGTCPP